MALPPDPTCRSTDHSLARGGASEQADLAACERAAAIFRSLGDTARLRTLTLLMRGEMCVTEIAEALGDSLPAVSQRLRLLKSERIVSYRREGKHVYYGLADQHIGELVANSLAHAREGDVESVSGGSVTAGRVP